MYVSSVFRFISSLILILEVLDPLQTWTRSINDFQRIVDISLRPSKRKSKAITAIENRAEILLPENPSAMAIGARNDIQTMWRVFKHTASGKLLAILTYAELLALSVSWFSKVRLFLLFPAPNLLTCPCKHNVDLPETALELGTAFREYA